MSKEPTYTAKQMSEMAQEVMDLNTLEVLINLIIEELSLYTDADLIILTHASLVLFNKSILIGSLSKL